MFSNVVESNGTVHLRCRLPMSETVARLESALTEYGSRVFARIDHSRSGKSRP